MKKVRVLYIDDLPDMGEMAQHACELDGRCELTVTTCAIEALKLIAEARESDKPFTAVITDIAMPRVDGYSFGRMLREMERGNAKFPAIRLAFVTAHGESAVDYALIQAVNGERCWFRPNDMAHLPMKICDWLGCDRLDGGAG